MRCGKYRHWYGDRNKDGSLRGEKLSFDKAISDRNYTESLANNSTNRTISFNSAFLSYILRCITKTQNRDDEIPVGPLVDSGTPRFGHWSC